MMPEEIAREIVAKCEHVPEFDEFALGDYQRTHDMFVPQVACDACIASALAASEQRGESAETRALLMTNRAVNAEAQLQASEEKIKRYEAPEYHVRHNCCTAVEASERALERVRDLVNRPTVLANDNQMFYTIVEIRKALASPGSPEEERTT